MIIIHQKNKQANPKKNSLFIWSSLFHQNPFTSKKSWFYQSWFYRYPLSANPGYKVIPPST
jgi:hypothetical protein